MTGTFSLQSSMEVFNNYIRICVVGSRLGPLYLTGGDGVSGNRETVRKRSL